MKAFCYALGMACLLTAFVLPFVLPMTQLAVLHTNLLGILGTATGFSFAAMVE